jgi:hypothetical protein
MNAPDILFSRIYILCAWEYLVTESSWDESDIQKEKLRYKVHYFWINEANEWELYFASGL